ncbi:Hypothetical predicted protein [Cloeon dipterum]|uniref:LITAF domain-containing protein n=1 Tax=Cloeon dipterum TaxID=197152 RepID=A0A8S1CI10_9INSE|nr:Hypothetical predicted protein [Cloeon dipterum]
MSSEKQGLPEDNAPPPYTENDAYPGPSSANLRPNEQVFTPYPTQAAPVLPPPVGQTVVTVAPNGQQQSVLVINARRPRVIIDGDLLPPFPFQIVCPCCRQMVQTRIEYRAGSATHLAAFLLCIFGCWPCCLLPYCLTSCQFPAHFCPNCQAFIGMAPNV